MEKTAENEAAVDEKAQSHQDQQKVKIWEFRYSSLGTSPNAIFFYQHIEASNNQSGTLFMSRFLFI